jgi:hypothetical protein
LDNIERHATLGKKHRTKANNTKKHKTERYQFHIAIPIKEDIYREYYMAKSVSYAVSSRETNIIQRAFRPEG